jgi:purine nucleoside permease
MRRASRLRAWLAAALAGFAPPAQADPIPIRVVVVAMFEPGADTGDQPGELQAWVERFPLPVVLPFPQGGHHLRYNPGKGVLAVLTGVGTARAAASIMALGTDPRFDLRRAYWLVAGIAGADPEDMSLGSAAWAEWLVDGDLAHEIDAREIPRGWSTGYLPLDRTEPYARPRPEGSGLVHHLDPGLVGWAYRLTRGTHLPDSAVLRRARDRFKGFPNARRPPSVIRGDNLGAMTYWHGALLNRWADRWVRYWTAGRGEFATSAQEDTGTAQALTFLDQAGKADFRRLLVLRTASNPTMQYPGITAAESLARETVGLYSAYLPALEAAYRVGSRAVDALLASWADHAERPPSAP